MHETDDPLLDGPVPPPPGATRQRPGRACPRPSRSWRPWTEPRSVAPERVEDLGRLERDAEALAVLRVEPDSRWPPMSTSAHATVSRCLMRRTAARKGLGGRSLSLWAS